jgi:hypothetical protein
MQHLGYEDGSRGGGVDRTRARGSCLISQEVAQTEAASSHPGQDKQNHDGATHHEDLRRPQLSEYDGLVRRLFDIGGRWRFRWKGQLATPVRR